MNFIGKILGVFIISVQIISYLITVFANPGFPKKLEEAEINSIEKGKGMQYCKRCGFFIQPGEGTFHCFECDVCIIGK
jgi:Zn finger protein HypA/HybF involved in hydrogenase expression